jgi:hypothetical protein
MRANKGMQPTELRAAADVGRGTTGDSTMLIHSFGLF